MTMLSNVEIREAIESGEIRIEPFREANVQPASYDLTLGDEFRHYYIASNQMVDPLDSATHCSVSGLAFGYKKGFLPAKRGLTLGCTAERITLGPSIAAQVGGKSSLARLGIEVHLTAGFIDAGFSGAITLEMVNNGPDDVLLTVGMDIAQLVFYRLGKPADPPYQGRYQGATGTQASKYHEGRGS